MISGDVLKYQNGFLIPKRYETIAITSSKIPLTTPLAPAYGSVYLAFISDPITMNFEGRCLIVYEKR